MPYERTPVDDPEQVPVDFERPWAAYESRWMGRFVGTPAELGVELELALSAEKIVAQSYALRWPDGDLSFGGCPPEYRATGSLTLRGGDGLLDEVSNDVRMIFDDTNETGSIYVSWPIEALAGTARPLAYNIEAWQDNTLAVQLDTLEHGGWALDLYFRGEQASGGSYQEDWATDTPLREEAR